ncbi:MAG: nucleotidyltransferase family protein [Bacteroidales bacterium]|nr:nucleotidyltransferase family protein [Bacteroidales bacterium]
MNQVFFALLRSGLWERPLVASELAAAAALDETGWAAILKFAREQTVLGLLYRAVTHLPSDFKLPDGYVLDLMAFAGGLVRENQTKTAVTEQLFDECAAAGLHPVVMKGQSVAAYYAHPELRTSGDIDLYFPPEEYQQALTILGGEIAPDGTRHIRRSGIDIDIHERYFDLHCSDSKLPAVGTPEATILLLSCHILKHAIGPGVGLRQCCDLAVAWHALAPFIDAAYMRELFRRTGTYRWNRLLFSFLADHLDLPNTLFPEERVSSEPLLRIILEGGNFGHHAKARTDALQASDRRRKRNTLTRFLHRLPFSLRYAPRETIATIFSLLRGNLK